MRIVCLEISATLENIRMPCVDFPCVIYVSYFTQKTNDSQCSRRKKHTRNETTFDNIRRCESMMSHLDLRRAQLNGSCVFLCVGWGGGKHKCLEINEDIYGLKMNLNLYMNLYISLITGLKIVVRRMYIYIYVYIHLRPLLTWIKSLLGV